jgi:hypothetical protein
VLRGGEAGGITAATSCVSLDAPQITSGKCVEFWYLLLLFTTFYLVATQMQTRLTCATTFAVLSAFKVCLLFVPVIEPLLIHHPLCEEVLEVWHGFSGQDGEFVGDYCEHDLSCHSEHTPTEVPGTRERVIHVSGRAVD